MSNLQNKLENISSIKQDLKGAIISKGQEITNLDSFNSYPEKILNISDSRGLNVYGSISELNSAVVNNGDIGVIYKSSTEYVQDNGVYSNIKFPMEVRLNSSISGVFYQQAASANNMGWEVDQYYANFCWQKSLFSSGNYVTYSSDDGLTYRATNISHNENIIVGKNINVTNLPEILRPFMVLNEQLIYGGIYQFNNGAWVTAPTQLNLTANQALNKTFYVNNLETGNMISEVVNIGGDANEYINVSTKLSNAVNTINLSQLSNCANLFQEFKHYFIPVNLNMNDIENAYDMFANARNICYVSDLNTTNLHNASGMFQNTNLVLQPNMDTSNITDCSRMFLGCNNLCGTATVASVGDNMSSTFHGCRKLEVINIGDTSKVSNFSQTFAYCKSLKSINIDVKSANELHYTFVECENLTNFPGIINEENIGRLFNTFRGLRNVTVPMMNFNNLKLITSAFANTINVNYSNLSNWDLSNVTDADYLFSSSDINDSRMPNLNMPACTDVYMMFANTPISNPKAVLDKMNLPNSNVYGAYMFYNSKITSIKDLDLSRYYSVGCMFYNTKNVTSVSNITVRNSNAAFMFELTGASSIVNMDIRNSNCYLMFRNANNINTLKGINFVNCNCYNMGENLPNLKTISNLRFEDLNIGHFAGTFPNSAIVNATNIYVNNCDGGRLFGFMGNLSNVSVTVGPGGILDTYSMFVCCYNLKTAPNFDTSKCKNMYYMFTSCTNLTSVPQYNTSNCECLRYLVMNCNNLSNASIQNIINMCLNSNVTNTKLKTLVNTNANSPFYNTKYNSKYYSNRLSELSAAGWSY